MLYGSVDTNESPRAITRAAMELIANLHPMLSAQCSVLSMPTVSLAQFQFVFETMKRQTISYPSWMLFLWLKHRAPNAGTIIRQSPAPTP